MLIHKKSLEEIRQHFRLNIYEVKIWTSLLSRGVAAASELADVSGVPRSRCYDVLESLEKKGFIIMKIGKPIKYLAVKPEAIVERVKQDLQKEAEQQITMVDNLSQTDIFKELELLHQTGVTKVDPESMTDSVTGRANINRFVKEMLLRAKDNVVVSTNEDGLKHKAKVLKKARRQLHNNGASVQVFTNAKAHHMVDFGTFDVKDSPYDARFVMVDNNEILFIMGAENPDFDSAVWVKSPFFVESISSLFGGN